MTDPIPLVDMAEQCQRRVVKAERVDGHTYYCVTLDCGHHAHPSFEFLRGEMECEGEPQA